MSRNSYISAAVTSENVPDSHWMRYFAGHGEGLNERLGESQMESRLLGHPASILDTIVTELYGLDWAGPG